jgi:hypothetical protein
MAPTTQQTIMVGPGIDLPQSRAARSRSVTAPAGLRLIPRRGAATSRRRKSRAGPMAGGAGSIQRTGGTPYGARGRDSLN